MNGDVHVDYLNIRGVKAAAVVALSEVQNDVWTKTPRISTDLVELVSKKKLLERSKVKIRCFVEHAVPIFLLEPNIGQFNIAAVPPLTPQTHFPQKQLHSLFEQGAITTLRA